MNKHNGWLTVRQLKAALEALPPEYEDAGVTLANLEYPAGGVEITDNGFVDIWAK